MKKILKVMFSRMVIVSLLILIQIAILVITIVKLSEEFVYLYAFFEILSIIVSIYIVSRNDNPSYKLAWVIPVLLVPIFGCLFYLLFGGNKIRRRLKKQIDEKHSKTFQLLKQDEEILNKIDALDKPVGNQFRYLYNLSYYPVYDNTDTEYLSPGEVFFDRLIEELKKAKQYIFLEYFIIHEGVMWSTILDILVEKAKQGVDVRIIYDDMGCITTLPPKYNKFLEGLGIKTFIFNRVVPVLSAVVNNRDHRKITVIDGHTAFTGGINLADEYINQIVRFGHWKDSALMIKGEAVWNFTIMFLHTWALKGKNEEDYTKFMPKENCDFQFKDNGFVQPFGDSPYNSELISENVYLNIISKAKNYVYITTPYLIIDNELLTALSLAAKSGVDVRIITPHIEDKWYVHMVTRANYAHLINAGVKIYEYTPGFIHSKTFVADDELGVVGTVNLDYRSLYLHFECGTLLYKTNSVKMVKKDFLDTISISKLMTIKEIKKIKWYNIVIRSILRAFSPLL
jgi:cardiolipin synthase